MVTVEIFEDLQCPDCARLQHMLDDGILERFAGKAVFTRRDFPLEKHPGALPLAEHAHYLRSTTPDQEWPWRRRCLFAIRRVEAPAEGRESIDADLQDAANRGVRRTPTVFVNGKAYVENFTPEELARAIEEAL